jgi:hypothetical protein
MIKFRFYYDKDAETDWLNEMSHKGYAFKNFFLGFYTFEECEPGEYIYQIDLLHNWSGDKEEFASFMEDSGVEVISQWYRWVYIRKKASEGSFELYTDIDTKIEQYSRIKRFFQAALGIELVCLIMELFSVIHTQQGVFWGFVILMIFFVLVFLRIIWKSSWKIEELKREKY